MPIKVGIHKIPPYLFRRSRIRAKNQIVIRYPQKILKKGSCSEKQSNSGKIDDNRIFYPIFTLGLI